MIIPRACAVVWSAPKPKITQAFKQFHFLVLSFFNSLRSLNLDSNAISGESIVKIISATSKNKTLQELRCSNQVTFCFYNMFFEMASMPFPCNGPLGVVLVFHNVLVIFWLVVLSLISIYFHNIMSSSMIHRKKKEKGKK